MNVTPLQKILQKSYRFLGLENPKSLKFWVLYNSDGTCVADIEGLMFNGKPEYVLQELMTILQEV